MFSTLLGYVLRAEGRQGKVTFYFENTPDPMDVKAMAEAEGVKIANLKALKELRDMDGIEEDVYEDAVEQVQSPKRSKHSAGIRVYGGNPSTRVLFMDSADSITSNGG